MKNKTLKIFLPSIICLSIFIIYTLCVKFIDVNNIGPNNSSVGFSSLNHFVNNLFDVNFTLYTVTDWAQIIAIIPAVVFAIMGFIQLIKRKKINKVDTNILALGILYIVTFIVYLTFQFVVINKRPVLINGILETSYPSSTTILALSFSLSSLYQIDCYIKNKNLNIILKLFFIFICVFLVIGRLISNVHWFTDIIGGIIISTTLLLFYYAIIEFFKNKLEEYKIKKIK